MSPGSSSLKGLTPGLAKILGTTPSALYERQRALVRAELLDLGDGRGPGSGVRATSSSVALLLLSVLATDRLSETEQRVRALMKMAPIPGKRCPFTGATTFLSALDSVLSSTGKVDLVAEIAVSRTSERAQIRYFEPGKLHNVKISEFGGKSVRQRGIGVEATIGIELLQEIAVDVQAVLFDEFEDD
jgi:hypothetical protein